MHARYFALAAIAVLLGASAALLNTARPGQRVDLRSAVQVWSDVVRDVDHFGLVVTRVSAAREMEIGREIDRMVAGEGALADNPAEQRYVEAVGARLAAHVDRKDIRYRFYVYDSPEINAFSLPGGTIYVTEGMLGFVQNEAELAYILGHEISHVDSRHCIERLQYTLIARKIALNDLGAIAVAGHDMLAAPYSSQQEFEADTGGVLLAADAGYDPRAAQAMLFRFAAREPKRSPDNPSLMVEEVTGSLADALHQYFASHPPTRDRLREVGQVLRRNDRQWRGRRFYLGRSNFQDRIARVQQARPGEWTIYDRSGGADGVGKRLAGGKPAA